MDIAQITGLPFIKRGSRYISKTYIDGTPHSRDDKTNARMKDGEWFVSEEGGECLHIKQWLRLYGDESKYVKPKDFKPEPRVERKFVPEYIYSKTFPSAYNGNLHRFLTSIFGIEKVNETYRKYCVGESSLRDTVYWYRDMAGNWLHDQVIPYAANGKRDKTLKFPGWRKCKQKYGYTGKGVFGGHLLKNWTGEVCVVESEKSALVLSMADQRGRLWLACGGSNKTAVIREGWKIFPDFDEAGKFWECIGCKNKSSKECQVRMEELNGRKVRAKDWGCVHANPMTIRWFEDLKMEDGDDPSDYVLNNII